MLTNCRNRIDPCLCEIALRAASGFCFLGLSLAVGKYYYDQKYYQVAAVALNLGISACSLCFNGSKPITHRRISLVSLAVVLGAASAYVTVPLWLDTANATKTYLGMIGFFTGMAANFSIIHKTFDTVT